MITLIVEDNPLDVRMVRWAIEQERWNVDIFVAEDGEKACKYLLQEDPYADAATPDFVILDLNLPKRSGAEILTLIRENVQLARIPVAIVSSSPEDVMRQVVDRRSLSADLFIRKPLNVEEYLAIGKQLRECYESRIRLARQASGSSPLDLLPEN